MENIKLAVDYGALGILLLMSILVVGYAIERFAFFKALHVKSYESKNRLERDVSKNLTIDPTNTPRQVPHQLFRRSEAAGVLLRQRRCRSVHTNTSVLRRSAAGNGGLQGEGGARRRLASAH